ncbi:glycosyltransferase family 10 domain-containing protein [Azospirillum sp. sgz301742]
MKRIFNLVDSSFAHDVGATAGIVPRGWAWDRSCADPNVATFYTNERIFEAPGGNCYALLWESKAIIPSVYDAVPGVIDRFKHVFTHDADLLARYPGRCLFIPGSGVWIGGSYGRGETKLYPKRKLVSIISSTKAMCPLHSFRFEVAKALQAVDGVDVFIAGGGHGAPGWVPIIDTLADYMYSIAIENHVDDFFFTEKILNCFATGTVPIYLGAKRIGNFFNEAGIIAVSTWEDLVQALGTLSLEDYVRRGPAIVDNLQRCRMYDGIENYLHRRYADLLPLHVVEEG